MVKQENNCVYDIKYQTVWLTNDRVELFRTDDRSEMIRCIIMGIDKQHDNITIEKINIDHNSVMIILSIAPNVSLLSATDDMRKEIEKAWFLEFPLDRMLLDDQLWNDENVVFSLNANIVQEKAEKRAKSAIESFQISMNEKGKSLW